MRCMRRQADDGFTMIELIVVMIIVAILMAITVPTYARARAQSRNNAMSSSFNRVGPALLMDSSGALGPTAAEAWV